MSRILCFLVLLSIIGCATVGKPIDQKQIAQLKDGITTQEEVLTAMSTPSDKTIIDTGEEKWTYVYSRVKPSWTTFVPVVSLMESSMKADSQKLEILFDEKKIVKKHTFSTPTTTIKSGILQ